MMPQSEHGACAAHLHANGVIEACLSSAMLSQQAQLAEGTRNQAGACMRTHAHTHLRTPLAPTHAFTHTHTRAHTHTLTCARRLHPHMHSHTYTHTHTHTHSHTCTHAHARAHTCTGARLQKHQRSRHPPSPKPHQSLNRHQCVQLACHRSAIIQHPIRHALSCMNGWLEH